MEKLTLLFFAGCTSEIPYQIGDGYCDDENNNINCHYDGGDCCLAEVKTDYCTTCICNKYENCTADHSNIGDGICHDETNNEDCSYDGGDCCGACVVKEYCLECQCIQNSYNNAVSNILVGDGVCHDETNIEACAYDGGDCCLSCGNKELCSECICHQQNFTIVDTSCK